LDLLPGWVFHLGIRQRILRGLAEQRKWRQERQEETAAHSFTILSEAAGSGQRTAEAPRGVRSTKMHAGAPLKTTVSEEAFRFSLCGGKLRADR
jgi:hypothetical protein